MKLLGNRKSKRTKLSLKYNIQKRVREHKRRVRKEAKKLGKKKQARKDPGIPNTWPFKAQMLQELERKKEEREKELEKRKLRAKAKAKRDAERQVRESREAARDKEAERRAKRAVDARVRDKVTLAHTLFSADVLLQVLDARDPMGCRCEAFEAWAHENGKRLLFVLSKADLISAHLAAQWLQVLGQVAPAVGGCQRAYPNAWATGAGHIVRNSQCAYEWERSWHCGLPKDGQAGSEPCYPP